MIGFKNARIILEDKINNNGCIQINDDLIKAIDKEELVNAIDLHRRWVLPEFIDCHVYGDDDVDFETGDEDDYLPFFSRNRARRNN